MAKIQVPYDESITEERLREILRTRLPRYTVESATAVVGGDFWVKKSDASGAVVKLKHKPEKGQTTILISGVVPSLAIRIVLALFLLIPFLVMMIVANSTVGHEVKEVLESDPTLGGAGGEAATVPIAPVAPVSAASKTTAPKTSAPETTAPETTATVSAPWRSRGGLIAGAAALAVVLVVAAVLLLAGGDEGNDAGPASNPGQGETSAASGSAASEIRRVVEEFSTSSDPAVCDLGTKAFHEQVFGGRGSTAIEACRTNLPRIKRSGQVSIRSLESRGRSARAKVTFGDGEEGEYTLVDAQEGWRLNGYVLTKEGSNTGEAREDPEAPTETVDVRSIEDSLESSLGGSGTTRGSGPKVTAVDCPASVPAEEGASFKCDASGERGLSGAVRITLDDARGESFSYKGKLKSAGVTSTVSGSHR